MNTRLNENRRVLAGGDRLPAKPGIGLKTQHLSALIEQRPEIGFVEVHAENYMVKGGARLYLLDCVRELYPLSIHGVGASLGGEGMLDETHLKHLKQLNERYQPQAFSEHLAWAEVDGRYLNDLLPLVYTEATLKRVTEQVDYLQNYLGRRILIENPATYLQFEMSNLGEPEFISELVKTSGCGLLLDLNNLYVTCSNHKLETDSYFDRLPLTAVEEIHLAGHSVDSLTDGMQLLIDSHDRSVCEPVWELYRKAIGRLGALPTLLEWDAQVPELMALVAEAKRADRYLLMASEAVCDAG